jgi:hypothetical protein
MIDIDEFANLQAKIRPDAAAFITEVSAFTPVV